MEKNKSNQEQVTEDDSIRGLQDYWAQRLDEFEKVEYPVFHSRLYSKNTALLAVVMDELTDAIAIANARRSK